jgi:hypothetical protein
MIKYTITNEDIRDLFRAYTNRPFKKQVVYPESFRLELDRILSGRPKSEIRVGTM